MGKVYVLMDNKVGGVDFIGEWGLSLLVELNGRFVLVDTGQTSLALENAEKMGCLPEKLDAILLSHGHHDHTGGLPAWLERYPGSRIVAHPQVFAERYMVADDNPRKIGIPYSKETVGRSAEIQLTTEPCRLAPGLTATGQVDRRTEFEDTGGAFYLDPKGETEDLIPDDQILVAEGETGLTLISGCAHSGIINILDRVAELFPGQPVATVIGGLHLYKAGPERIEPTIERLDRAGVERLVVGHCTGDVATAKLYEALPGRVEFLGIGGVIEF